MLEANEPSQTLDGQEVNDLTQLSVCCYQLQESLDPPRLSYQANWSHWFQQNRFSTKKRDRLHTATSYLELLTLTDTKVSNKVKRCSLFLLTNLLLDLTCFC